MRLIAHGFRRTARFEKNTVCTYVLSFLKCLSLGVDVFSLVGSQLDEAIERHQGSGEIKCRLQWRGKQLKVHT